MCEEVRVRVNSEHLVKVVDYGEGLWLYILNGAETDETELNAHENDHNGHNPLEQHKRHEY